MKSMALAWCASLALVCASCGDDVGGGAFDAAPPADAPTGGGGADASNATFALTSTAFGDGQAIPAKYSCEGQNVSPPLSWTNAAGAQSYALIFRDTSIGLVHAVMWDIPDSTTSLAENVDKVAEPSVPAGAKQSLAYDGSTRGYLGPCPPSAHDYEFVLHAIPSATLSGVSLQSSRDALVTAIEAASTASAQLTTSYTPQ